MCRHRQIWFVAVAVLLGGCARERVDASPQAAVEAFVDRMRSVHGDPVHGQRALELIASDGRKNLRERARRASALSGRAVAPEEMLVPSRFSVNFEPLHYSAEVKGKWSRVTVTGANPARELAEIPCLKEEGGWRVAIQFPPLPPIERREGD